MPEIIILTLEQIKKHQQPGAQKPPKKILEEQKSGQTIFVQTEEEEILRQVSSAVMIVDPTREESGIWHWHEFGHWFWDKKSQIWKFKERKYPFPAEGMETGENPRTALIRGLQEEFGLSEGEFEIMIPLSSHPFPLSSVKPSLTAGFKTLYQFHPFHIFLKTGVEIKSTEIPFPSSSYPIPPGEIWRTDGSNSKFPKVICFREERVPINWESLIMTT